MARWVRVSSTSNLLVSKAGRRRHAVVLAVLALVAACTERPGQGSAQSSPAAAPLAPLAGAEVLVGAGDIASCASAGDEATAALLDRIPGTVFTAGDNVYPNGRPEEFRRCYHPSWGRHRDRTYPVPGNHDYRTRDGGPYYEYFGDRAGPPGLGFYSFELGEWLILMLNTNIPIGRGSAQLAWLEAQLAGHSGACEIAVSHHPRFSSGPHGRASRMAAAWEVLYQYGAELAIGGHDHIYERFAPMTPSGARDDVRGVRQFVAGTGGFRPYTPRRRALRNSEVRSGTSGVLKLELGDGVYQWEFVPVAGRTFSDWGRGKCR